MGAVAVSGKKFFLSNTKFFVVYNSQTVEEIDTKLILPRLQHLCMCSALRIFLQCHGQGQLMRLLNYSCGLYLKHFLTDTGAV